MSDKYSPIVELTRGGIVESYHLGAFAVVDDKGVLLAHHGDPMLIAYPRSSEKPFQALPFLEINGDSAFHLTDKEIAIICASHTGSNEHVTVIKALQEKTGVSEKDLLCGVHPPYDRDAILELEKNNQSPTPNRNNCSGKHTGMLAHARLLQFPTDGYIDPEHPLQQLIRKSFAEFCDLDERDLVTGIDGCSAPNHAVPLIHFATAFARLANPQNMPASRASACNRITHAMITQPEMVSGVNRFDTVLMQLGKGKIISKAGAEGYQAIGIMQGALGKDSPAIGIAIKIADGDSEDYQTSMHRQFDGDEPFHLSGFDTSNRARPCVAVELLRQLDALDEDALQVLSSYAPRPLYNWRKSVVGQIRTTFKISRKPGF